MDLKEYFEVYFTFFWQICDIQFSYSIESAHCVDRPDHEADDANEFHNHLVIIYL